MIDSHKKVNVLSRITPYMNTAKRRILMNSFFASRFGYCPLIWMFHNHTINNKINGLHERCLRIVYSDKNSNYKQLLEKDGSVLIHNRNLQILATEMFKVSKNLSITIVKDIFQRKESPYDLRNNMEFSSKREKCFSWDRKCIIYRPKYMGYGYHLI